MVTLVSVWVIFRRGKGQGRAILNILPLLYLLVLKEMCASTMCKKWFLAVKTTRKGWSSSRSLWEWTPGRRVVLWAQPSSGKATAGCSVGWGRQWWKGGDFLCQKPARVLPVAGKRGRVPGGDECPRGGCAKKIWLAAEQLASAANSDWLAQEDPNYSTTAVSIIAAAGAARAIRHWKGPGCGSERLLELVCSVLATELHKTYQMSGRKKWVILGVGLCK